MTEPRQTPTGGSYRYSSPRSQQPDPHQQPDPDERTEPEASVPDTVTGPTEDPAPVASPQDPADDSVAESAGAPAFPGYTPPSTGGLFGDAFPAYAASSNEAPPMAEAGEEEGSFVCPTCADPVEAWEGFCEACGQVMTPQAPMPKAEPAEQPAADGDHSVATRVAGRSRTSAPRHPCTECGGAVGDDNYCQVCGAKGPDPRDHYRELPADWVAGVCDIGLRHHRNEDAMAIAADEATGSRAVLVVCDGVSTAEDSDIASLAAARTARGVLVGTRPDPQSSREERLAVVESAIIEAADQANEAVVAKTRERSRNATSCTFVAAVIDGDDIVYGNIGDSRAYWIDDQPGASRLLTTDDSVAQSRIAMGVDRETAEKSPQAHAITKWLGRDTPDAVPAVGAMTVTSPGWLLVCSDGLWNYASEPEELHQLVAEAIQRNERNAQPRSLAVSLTRWARMKGGKDNITVTLARLGDAGERHNGSNTLNDGSVASAESGSTTDTPPAQTMTSNPENTE